LQKNAIKQSKSEIKQDTPFDDEVGVRREPRAICQMIGHSDVNRETGGRGIEALFAIMLMHFYRWIGRVYW
jgi:hypothetical protein